MAVFTKQIACIPDCKTISVNGRSLVSCLCRYETGMKYFANVDMLAESCIMPLIAPSPQLWSFGQ